jgi:predicted nucleic acid-binding protein
MNHTLDASALLRFIDNEAGSDAIKKLFLDAYNQRTELYINAVNWSEIVYTFLKRGGTGAYSKIQQVAALPITLVTVDEQLASLVANYRLTFKLHLADALALATAVHTRSTLVTADFDFKVVGSGASSPIQFLPKK